MTQLQGINQVFVIKSDNTAEVRNVTLGDMAGSSYIVTSGLQPGEKVVVEGVQKCTQGGPVTPLPYVPPASETAPATNAPAAAAPSSP